MTLVHTLHLLGSDENLRKIRAADGRLMTLLKSKKSDAEVIDELMLVALGRLPRDGERKVLLAHLESRREAGGRIAAFEDYVWALLNTKEFLFNH